MHPSGPNVKSLWIIGSLIESKKREYRVQSLVIFPISTIIHAIVIGSLILFSLSSVSYRDNAPVWVSLKDFQSFYGTTIDNKGERHAVRQIVNNDKTAVIGYAPSIIPDNLSSISTSAKQEAELDRKELIGEEFAETKARMAKTLNISPKIDIAALLRLEPPKRIGIDAQGIQPRVISRVQPAYPEVALRAFIEGMVVLEIVVSKFGTVADVKVLKSVNPLLDKAAVDAVYQWKFEPGKINNIPMNAYLTVTVIFKLKENDNELSM